jgi:hypothetical protein
VLAAGALYLVGVGSAGTSNFSFTVVAGPTLVTTNAQGMVFARFSPDASSGSATHTVITFTFPVASVASAPAATTSDCGAATLDTTGTLYTIACNIGTVNPGQVVKRFVIYTAGTTLGDAGISASVSFDAGTGGKGKGGGAVNGPSTPAGATIVDGGSAAGLCQSGGSTIQTAPLSTTVLQQTGLSFGDGLGTLGLPCSWGAVAVLNGQRGKDGAPQISSVGGPKFAGAANLTLTFSSLPVPLNKYVLEENESFDPNHPSQGWFPVPACSTDANGNPVLPDGADACLIGYDKGKTIVAHLLYAGTGGDPWFN